MKEKIRFLVIFLVCLSAVSMPAQEQKLKEQLYLVADVIVKPSEAVRFNEATKEEVAFYAKHKYPYSWNVTSTGDFTYSFSMKVKDFADIENFLKPFGEKEDPDGYRAMLERFNGTFEYIKWSVWTFKPDLSFMLKKTNDTEKIGNFVYYLFEFVIPGKETEYLETLKEFVALSKRKNMNQQNWFTYAGGIGTEQPVYVYIAQAKNAVGFYSQNAKMHEALGEEGIKLRRKLTKYVRKMESKTGWYRKNLSYIQKK